MDNKFGIIGYKKESKNTNKTCYIILTGIFVYTFVLAVILGFFSIIIGIYIHINIFLYIFFYIKCYYYNDNEGKRKRFTKSKRILSLYIFQR